MQLKSTSIQLALGQQVKSLLWSNTLASILSQDCTQMEMPFLLTDVSVLGEMGQTEPACTYLYPAVRTHL